MRVSFDHIRCAVLAGGTGGTNLGIAKAFALTSARVGVAHRIPDKVEAAPAQPGGGLA